MISTLSQPKLPHSYVALSIDPIPSTTIHFLLLILALSPFFFLLPLLYLLDYYWRKLGTDLSWSRRKRGTCTAHSQPQLQHELSALPAHRNCTPDIFQPRVQSTASPARLRASALTHPVQTLQYQDLSTASTEYCETPADPVTGVTKAILTHLTPVLNIHMASYMVQSGIGRRVTVSGDSGPACISTSYHSHLIIQL